MFPIVERTQLNSEVVRLRFLAPTIARKAEAGQFAIVRPNERGERIPLTIAGYDRVKGTIDLIFRTVGASTLALAALKAGEGVPDLAGPLGEPTELDGLRKVIVVGGGVGCAIALPVAKVLSERGAKVFSVIGFRNRDLVILEKEFAAFSEVSFLTTDDGSAGEHGNVCAPLARLLESGTYDEVFTVGPLVMMKYVAETTRRYNVKTIASMNPIMIDGTGMCGCCRLTVGGERKFACVDGPDFDAHKIDFDEAILRDRTYSAFEARSRERACKLYQKEVKQ